MPNSVKLISVTHKTISLKDVKHFVVDSNEVQLADRLSEIKSNFGFNEFYYLATCNRVLFLFVTEDSSQNINPASFFEYVCPNLPEEIKQDLDQKVLHLDGMTALQHLLEVASSVDSLVIGEREILRQLREAYNQCKTFGITGDYIRIIIDHAIVSAKAVYSKTKIGEKPVSVVSLAIRQLLQTQLSKDSKILLIGAGQTNRLVAKFLAKHQFTNIVVFNRTLAKAQQLTEICGGDAHLLSKLPSYRGGFDGIIVCTGAKDPIIVDSLYQKLLGNDTSKKVIIDLAIPHNVTPTVVYNHNVKYIEIEGLKSLANDNLAFREKEVIHAKQISRN